MLLTLRMGSVIAASASEIGADDFGMALDLLPACPVAIGRP